MAFLLYQKRITLWYNCITYERRKMAKDVQTFRVERELKKEFAKLAEDIGLTPTAMLTAFMKKSVDIQGLPFSLEVEENVEKKIKRRKK